MSWLISFVLVDSICEVQEESENDNIKKFLPTVGHKPTTSGLLDGHSNQLRHRTILTVDIYR